MITLREQDLCFLSNRIEYDRADNFILEPNGIRLVSKQKRKLSAGCYIKFERKKNLFLSVRILHPDQKFVDDFMICNLYL